MARLFCLATDGAWVALLLIASASAVYDVDDSQVVALIGEDEGLAPPVEYDSIPGLRYEPKSALEFDEKTLSECQNLCDTRGAECSAFSYDAGKQECKISKDHLGYDPDFIMEQRTGDGQWDYLPGMTGYARGYLRVEMQTEPQCKALCAKAPACALFSYRKLDGLCLVSGRALAMDDNWTYYEKKGVAKDSKGFPLPPQLAHAQKMKEVHAATAAYVARQMAALKAEEAERQAALKASAAKEKAEAEKVQAEDAKVSALDEQIAKVKNDEQQKINAERHRTKIELEKEEIELAKKSDLELDKMKLASAGGQGEIRQAEQEAAAKVALAQMKSKDMLKSARLAAEKETYASEAKEAERRAQQAKQEALKEGYTEEEVKEHASKKAAIEIETRRERASQDLKTRQKMQLLTNARIARIEQEADHAADSVNAAVTRSASQKLRMDLVDAKNELAAQEKVYEASLKTTADNDAAHLKRVHFWKSKIAEATASEEKLRHSLLSVESAKDAAVAGVHMQIELEASQVPARTETAKLEAVAKVELEEMKKARQNAVRDESERFLARQRAEQKVADEAAQEQRAKILGQQEAKPALTKVEAAKAKLDNLAKAASKLPKETGKRLLIAAQEEYDNLVKTENEALAEAARNPPSIETRQIGADSVTGLDFDISKAQEVAGDAPIGSK